MANRNSARAERAASDPNQYELLVAQLEQLASEETHWLPVLANAAALLGETLPDINWVGFYVVGSLLTPELDERELVLGPFAGKVACVHIPFGRGVCGTAAERDEVLRVDDVHSFAGHIACDAASRSELVIPLHARGRVTGVLDIDSPLLARFDATDEAGLVECAQVIERCL